MTLAADPGNLTEIAKQTATQGAPAITVWKAAAYGELDNLQKCLVEQPALINKPDEQGFYSLQWAALNNRTNIVHHLIENGAQINMVDHTGQTALHWAAVRGSLSAAELLLKSGADLRIRDSRGYTAAHVAAQYGQTALLYYLALRWDPEVNELDNDGRTCLHWAAYKGFTDTIRLLLVLNAQIDITDKEGCTALHWAAIRGNGEACTVLIQGGSAGLLTATDVTGSTPGKLASEKGHRFLANYLQDAQHKEDKHHSLCGKAGALSFLTSTQLCPIIWLIIISLVALFVYKIVQISSLPELGFFASLASWTCIITASTGLVLLYRVTVSDPGYLPRSNGSSSAARSQSFNKGIPTKSNKQTLDQILGRSGKAKGLALDARNSSDASDRLLEYKELDSPALWAGSWGQLCVSCKIVRPLRAKHCAMSDRCVEEFDHFCPWVGNTIGKANRFMFLTFLVLVSVAMLSSLSVAILRMHQASSRTWNRGDGTAWIVAFIFFDGLLLLGVAALTITQASQIARNVTTNELANWPRYKYLRNSDGSFRNPFDRGCKKNCMKIAFPSGVPSAPVVLSTQDLETGGAFPHRHKHCCGSGRLH